MFVSSRFCGRALGAALALCLLLPVGSAFAQDADATVQMQGFTFVPTEIHVPAGGTVAWVNSTTFPHTVTADDGSFDSGNLDPTATFTQSFDTPGTYTYFCTPHAALGMKGVVVVDDPNAEAPQPQVAGPASAPPVTAAPDNVPDH
jgi:plastocyanin